MPFEKDEDANGPRPTKAGAGVILLLAAALAATLFFCGGWRLRHRRHRRAFYYVSVVVQAPVAFASFSVAGLAVSSHAAPPKRRPKQAEEQREDTCIFQQLL